MKTTDYEKFIAAAQELGATRVKKIGRLDGDIIVEAWYFTPPPRRKGEGFILMRNLTDETIGIYQFVGKDGASVNDDIKWLISMYGGIADMTKEQLAEKLHGNEYTKEISNTLEIEAAAAGLVVVFGASDDLIEFRGAIHDEAGAYEGGEFWIIDGKLWESHGCDHHGGDGCEYARAAEAEIKKRAALIKAEWDDDDYSWIYRTHIPHATFDVMEGKEKYCRGIIFSLSDAV